MIEKGFDFGRLYRKIVRYYITKHHYTKEKANMIAQSVVRKEMRLRTCQNSDCSHLLYDHLRNYQSCLVGDCKCQRFQRVEV
ncbi:MAG: hypothetical protein QXE84_07915 [Candidatus Nitrosotenuis sp.]|uniref:Uncharacterized protein n=1 Tax=Candidatus Nitrosotenuis uzonensis TaxID=1407055 RepID=A0A812F6J3_9ARCH|nr:hypothetical protein [Candidatus Nitrosotenuis uzonensis]CAE6500505.1 conserved hypothetical protein [Candidatus Nitrosotenuis uzonensis]